MAYDMRISDWSSDVCSADLAGPIGQPEPDSPARKAGLDADRQPQDPADRRLSAGEQAARALLLAARRAECLCRCLQYLHHRHYVAHRRGIVLGRFAGTFDQTGSASCREWVYAYG